MDRKNNNLSNLRYATTQQNSQNAGLSKRNKIGVKGISYVKHIKKFQARIMLNGVAINLGYYTNLDDAKNARINKANELFGEYVNECEKIPPTNQNQNFLIFIIFLIIIFVNLIKSNLNLN